MKIGILSMQKVINYGSFLQAFGLRGLIKEATGVDAKFIDIEKGCKLELNKIKIRKRVVHIIELISKGLFLSTIRDKKYKKKLANQFYTDFFPLLNLNEKNNSEEYDCIVVGSDEVFHCTQNAAWGFSTQLLGNINNSKKKISYAASFGATTYEKLQEFGVTQTVIENLRKFDSISVRDVYSKQLVYKLIGTLPYEHFDPVLLYDFSKEIDNSTPISVDEKYLIVYSYTGRIIAKQEIKNIINFAKSKKLKIYTIFCQYSWSDKTIIPDSPFQVLRYFKNASYVISDTFHGSIFSIITKRSFCTIVRDTNKEKILSLFSSLGITDRAIFNTDEISKVMEPEIDYNKIDDIRKKQHENSLMYLKENIG